MQLLFQCLVCTNKYKIWGDILDYIIIFSFFVLGTIFGSFYNVVGYRVPKGKSLLYPSSHCTNCNHNLSPLELIPIISYLFLGGKCKKCKQKISLFYPFFEFLTGILFVLSYISFGLSLECIYSLVFVSILVIIIISDYQTMIIPDSVLIVGSAILITIKIFMFDLEVVGLSLLNALLAFITMLTLKIFGDFLFKKESMGGGDIKLLGVFGLVLGYPLSIISIFLSAFIALPVSIILLKIKSTHEIPFGPFLSIAALIIFLTRINFVDILNFLNIF